MNRGSILVVCTGNICRSPVGEAILHDALQDAGIDVTSAGTHAPAGRAAAPETVEFVSRHLNQELDHVARQLDRATSEAADLILTMTQEHRSWVAKLAPRTVRRVYTLIELEKVLALLPAEQRFGTVRELAMAASRLRARAGADDVSRDIADPYGGPAEGYEESFRQVQRSSQQVAMRITHHIDSTDERIRS